MHTVRKDGAVDVINVSVLVQQQLLNPSTFPVFVTRPAIALAQGSRKRQQRFPVKKLFAFPCSFMRSSYFLRQLKIPVDTIIMVGIFDFQSPEARGNFEPRHPGAGGPRAGATLVKITRTNLRVCSRRRCRFSGTYDRPETAPLDVEHKIAHSNVWPWQRVPCDYVTHHRSAEEDNIYLSRALQSQASDTHSRIVARGMTGCSGGPPTSLSRHRGTRRS